MAANEKGDGHPSRALAERVTWFEYRGKWVVEQDFSHLSEPQMLEQMRHNHQTILQTGREGFCELLNVEGTSITSKVLDLSKELAADIDPLVYRSAVLGVHGIKKLVLRVYNSFASSKLEPFDQREDALRWLVA